MHIACDTRLYRAVHRSASCLCRLSIAYSSARSLCSLAVAPVQRRQRMEGFLRLTGNNRLRARCPAGTSRCRPGCSCRRTGTALCFSACAACVRTFLHRTRSIWQLCFLSAGRILHDDDLFLRAGYSLFVLFRNRVCDQPGKVAGVQNLQPVQCSCRRDIQKLRMSIVYRIGLPIRAEQQNRIEFQSLGIFHRKYHDSFFKRRFFRIPGHDRQLFLQKLCRLLRLLLIPADHRDRVKTVCLPSFADFCRFPVQIPSCCLSDANRFAMPDDRLCPIPRELSVRQDVRCKICNFYGISIAFSQYAKVIPFSGQQDVFHPFPVADTVIHADILGYIPHDRISAASDAFF